jgi:hypothetical protein
VYAQQIFGFDEASAASAASAASREAFSTVLQGCAAFGGNPPLTRRWLGSDIGRWPSPTLGRLTAQIGQPEVSDSSSDWSADADAESGSGR